MAPGVLQMRLPRDVDPNLDPAVAHLHARIDFLLEHIETMHQLIEKQDSLIAALRSNCTERERVIKAITTQRVDRA